MFRGIHWPEILVILAVAMVLFGGATRLPQIGKSLGASMRAFKRAIGGEDESEQKQSDGEKATAERPKE